MRPKRSKNKFLVQPTKITESYELRQAEKPIPDQNTVLLSSEQGINTGLGIVGIEYTVFKTYRIH